MDLRTYRTSKSVAGGVAVEMLLAAIEQGGEVEGLLGRLYSAFPMEIKAAYWEILKRAVGTDMRKGSPATTTQAVLSLYPNTLIYDSSALLQVLIESIHPSGLPTASLLAYRCTKDLQHCCQEPALATFRQAAAAASDPSPIYALFALIRNKKRWLEGRNFLFTHSHSYSGLCRLPKPLAGSIVQFCLC